MSDHESPDRTIHVKDADRQDHAPAEDTVREATEEADAEDPTLGGSSDADTAP